MSETGMTMTKKQIVVNGAPEQRTVVTFGEPPRTIEVVELDLGAQFDLAEVVGGQPDNIEYRNLAFAAASVREIDGIPTFTGAGKLSKEVLRGTLRKLGVDGLRAVGAAIGGQTNGEDGAADQATEEAHRIAVGN